MNITTNDSNWYQARYPDVSMKQYALKVIEKVESTLKKLEKELENENKIYKRRTGRTG